jgi:hypothetical protein
LEIPNPDLVNESLVKTAAASAAESSSTPSANENQPPSSGIAGSPLSPEDTEQVSPGNQSSSLSSTTVLLSAGGIIIVLGILIWAWRRWR